MLRPPFAKPSFIAGHRGGDAATSVTTHTTGSKKPCGDIARPTFEGRKKSMAGLIRCLFVFSALSANAGFAQDDPISIAEDVTDVIPRAWLDKPISIQEAEARNMAEGIAFGANNKEWLVLKGAAETGDQLWTFCSPYASFESHAGRCGIALVHSGHVARQLTTIMN
jgi:hypothetical protein